MRPRIQRCSCDVCMERVEAGLPHWVYVRCSCDVYMERVEGYRTGYTVVVAVMYVWKEWRVTATYGRCSCDVCMERVEGYRTGYTVAVVVMYVWNGWRVTALGIRSL